MLRVSLVPMLFRQVREVWRFARVRAGAPHFAGARRHFGALGMLVCIAWAFLLIALFIHPLWTVLLHAQVWSGAPLTLRQHRRATRFWVVRPARTSGSSVCALLPCRVPPTSPTCTRPGSARRRSARRCTSASTSSLTGGKTCP